MDFLEKMGQSKVAFYEAASALLEHVNDQEAIFQYEANLERSSGEYIEALLDLAKSISEETRYRRAIRETANRLGPFMFEISQVVEYHRKKHGLET